MLAEPAVTEVAELLDRYRSLAAAQREEAVSDFRRRFTRLRDEFGKTKSAAQERAREHAPGFNIFRLLGVYRDEQRTHSALLADLLDPAGSHGQRHVFLQRFLEYCGQKFDLPAIAVDDLLETEWVVRTEYQTPFGRLDILIRNAELGLLYVVENKIYSPEQWDQLRRYADWLETQQGEYARQALFYLTLSGKRATSHQGALYHRLSYYEDVAAWLEGSLGRVAAPRVRETITQYLDLIQTL